MLDRIGSALFLYLAAILAGFALIKISDFQALSSLSYAIQFISVIVIIVFAAVIIIHAVKALLKR